MDRVLDLCARFEARLRDWRVVVALVLLLGVHCGNLVTRRMGDFRIYHLAAQRLVEGDPVHRADDDHRFLYAPVVTFLFVPFAFLPVIPAAVLWYALNLWLLVASLRLAERLVYADGRAPPGFRVLLLLLVLRFVDNNLGHGQINILLLWFVLAAYDAAGRGSTVRAAFALAAAILIKFFPLVLLLHLALARRWKLLFATVGAAAVLLAAPALWWGDAYWDVLGHWIDVLRHQVGHYATANKINQSVAAFAYRLFRPYAEGTPLVELSAETVARITLAFHGAFLAALVAFSLFRARKRSAALQGDDAAELALYLLYATVVSHYSWKSYFINLMLPFAVVVRRAVEDRQFGGVVTVAGPFALNVLPGLGVFGRTLAQLLQLWSLHFVSVIWLFVAIAWPSRRRASFPVPTPKAVC